MSSILKNIFRSKESIFYEHVVEENIKQVIKYLDKFPNRINDIIECKENEIKGNPLTIAIINNQLSICKLLIETYKAAITKMQVNQAITAKNIYIVDQYYNKNPEAINELIEYGFTPLTAAAESKQYEICKLLIEKYKANVNQSASNTHSALHYAAGSGCIDIIKLLLNNKGNIHIKDADAFTPLMQAAYCNKSEVVKLLLDNKGDIDAVSNNNRTALLYAAQYNRIECVKILLCYGADINIKSNEGLLAIDYARKNNTKELIELLEKHKDQINNKSNGNNVHTNNSTNNNDHNQSSITTKERVYKAIEIGNIELIDYYFTQNPALINEILHNDYTALTIAAEHNQYDICKLLIEKHKANVNQLNGTGWSTLHYVAHMGNIEIMKLLLNNKANINAVNKMNTTALSYAADKNCIECVSILLEYGADINIKSDEGLSAIDYASQRHNKKIIELLKKASTDTNASL